MSSTVAVERDGVTNAELATLDEETKTTLQLDEIQRRTLEPGIMRLAVSQVSTSEDASKVVVDVEHPIEGDVRFHLDKPATWDPSNELVQFLDWYDLSIASIYHLQTRDVYVRQEADAFSGWRLVRPPDKPRSVRERLPSHWRAFDRLRPGFDVAETPVALDLWLYATTAMIALAAFALGHFGEPSSTTLGAIAVIAMAIGVLAVLLVSSSMILGTVVVGE